MSSKNTRRSIKDILDQNGSETRREIIPCNLVQEKVMKDFEMPKNDMILTNSVKILFYTDDIDIVKSQSIFKWAFLGIEIAA